MRLYRFVKPVPLVLTAKTVPMREPPPESHAPYRVFPDIINPACGFSPSGPVKLCRFVKVCAAARPANSKPSQAISTGGIYRFLREVFINARLRVFIFSSWHPHSGFMPDFLKAPGRGSLLPAAPPSRGGHRPPPHTEECAGQSRGESGKVSRGVGRAVPSAPRGCEDVRNARLWRPPTARWGQRALPSNARTIRATRPDTCAPDPILSFATVISISITRAFRLTPRNQQTPAVEC